MVLFAGRPLKVDSLCWLIGLSLAGEFALRAALPQDALPPAVGGGAFGLTLATTVVWLAPAVLWIYRALLNRGRVRAGGLRVSPFALALWSLLAAFVGRLEGISPGVIAGSMLATLAVGALAIAAARSGAFVLNLSIAVLVAGALSTVFFCDLTMLRTWLHVLHLSHTLTFVHGDQLIFWCIGIAATSGTLTLVALSWSSADDATARRPISGTVRAASVTDDRRRPVCSVPEHAFETARPRGEHSGTRAEFRHSFLTALRTALRPLGWSVIEKLGPSGGPGAAVDAYLMSPQGVRYAIAASAGSASDILYDPLRADLTAVRADGTYEDLTSLRTLLQARAALESRGLGKSVPVVCALDATIHCKRNIRGVTILAADELIAWLLERDLGGRRLALR